MNGFREKKRQLFLINTIFSYFFYIELIPDMLLVSFFLFPFSPSLYPLTLSFVSYLSFSEFLVDFIQFKLLRCA